MTSKPERSPAGLLAGAAVARRRRPAGAVARSPKASWLGAKAANT